MLFRGDDKDEDDFHVFARRFTAWIGTLLRTYIHMKRPITILRYYILIRGLLNHFMKMKVETPTTLPYSSARTSPYIHPLAVIVANMFLLVSS